MLLNHETQYITQAETVIYFDILLWNGQDGICIMAMTLCFAGILISYGFFISDPETKICPCGSDMNGIVVTTDDNHIEISSNEDSVSAIPSIIDSFDIEQSVEGSTFIIDEYD